MCIEHILTTAGWPVVNTMDGIHNSASSSCLGIHRSDGITLLNPIVQTIEGYFGFAKQAELNAAKFLFDQQMAIMVCDGTITRINHNYGLEY